MKAILKKKSFLYLMALLTSMSLLQLSCRKPEQPDVKPGAKEQLNIMSSTGPVSIKFTDIMAKLPQTVMYAIGDDLTFYTGKYESLITDSTLAVRIPTSPDSNHYVYAVRNLRTGILNAYLVRFEPEPGSTRSNFTGKQIWLDLQDWHTYGVAYTNNVASQTMVPIQIAEPGWEQCMIDNGYFSLGNDGELLVYDNPPVTYGLPDYRCPKSNGGSGWFKRMITGISEFLGSGGTDDGGIPSPPIWINGGGGGSSSGPGGIGSAGGGGGDSDWTPGGSIANGPVFANDGVGENGGGVTPNTNTAAAYIVYYLNMHGQSLTQQEVNYLVFHNNPTSDPNNPINRIQYFIYHPYPGFTGQQMASLIKEHISTLTSSTDYSNEINNLTGNWWDRDQDGLVKARKIQMELYLQANPQGMLDCNELATLPMTMYQDVGSYQIPQAVVNRINTIRSDNAPAYTTSNFRIKGINEASGGVVNCDYFYIQINSLPYMNNVQMTADQLLEYFRTNLNSFISPSVNVSFQPYIDNFTPAPGGINETAKWNSSYENSLGALVHIAMIQDGTVVESGYSRNNVTNNHSFTFTTMYTPVDGNHPVAGNRRFGIFASGGAYYFYILGIDRTNDFATTLANIVTNAAFDGADDLWHNVQSHILDFCDTHQGDALFAEEKISRPKWIDVKEFLKGQISLQQYKANLHCP